MDRVVRRRGGEKGRRRGWEEDEEVGGVGRGAWGVGAEPRPIRGSGVSP